MHQHVALNGEDTEKTALETIKLGASDYLTKPCEIDELVAKIEGAWEKKDDAEQKNIQEKIHKGWNRPARFLRCSPRIIAKSKAVEENTGTYHICRP